MKKYVWKDANLKRKSQRLDWAMYGFGLLVLLLWVMNQGKFLLVPFGLALVCFVLSWRVRIDDSKLKSANSKEEKK